jgi:hypothetical protein
MSDFKQIERGLNAYLAADASLIALLGTYENKPAIFSYTAPPGVEPPYICYFSIGILPDDTYDTRQDNATYQINVHTYKASTAYDIFSVLDDLLHLQTFTVDNYTNLFVKRIRGITRLQLEEEEEVLGLSADYKILLQE